MNINELPDDGLILIFKKIPLFELIPLREVCVFWKIIIDQLFDGKTSLKVFNSIEDVGNYCSDLLRYNLQDCSDFKLTPVGSDDFLNPEIGYDFEKTIKLFPNVQHFSCIDCFPFEENLFCKLTTLTLSNLHRTNSTNLANLNEIETLKNLHLFRFNVEIAQEMPILAQLEEFSLCSYNFNCIALLKQLGPNLKKLTLKFLDVKLNEFEDLFKEKLELQNLTHFAIESVINDELEYEENILEHKKLFHFVCSHFKELKWLEIKPEPALKHDEAIFSLNQLTNLKELRLLGFWNMQVNLLSQQLKTIKVLRIQMDHYFPHVNFQAIFPNLDRFIISGSSNLIEDVKKYLSKHPISKDTEIKHVPIGDRLDYMGRHRQAYEEYLAEQERLENEQYYDDYDRNDYDDDDYYKDEYYYENRTHDTEDSIMNKTWNS